MKRNCKVISIFNQKGGTSKSTSTLNISTALTFMQEEIFSKSINFKDRDLKKHPIKCLVIDNDGQANTTYILTNGKDDDDLEKGGYKTVNDLFIDKSCDVEDVIYPSKFENIDIIPSSIDHVYTDMQIITTVDNNRILLKKLKKIKEKYDFILIDNPPSISLTTYNSLMCADTVIAPVESSVFSAKGLSNLINLIADMNSSRDEKLRLLSFLSKVDNRKAVKNVQTKKALECAIGDSFIKNAHISMLSVYTDTLEDFETAVSINKNNTGCNEYTHLTKTILERMKVI
ncbi:ParA family protein [Clostridium tarantellae]|uniref:AAA family ATPase n=1 Tax=Clostridium tarantellae TaxID=39493 RepID=A0A6I1MPF3_9CLOT|nr:AAA family ATPase [Clostridium tarantellae]MPQ44673.1 AAA family ATPase [Clostridium tarantellae]